MNYHITSAHCGTDIKSTVSEAVVAFNDPKLILFCSPVDHFSEYAREIANRFPNAVSMGMTTLMSISKNGAQKNDLLCLGIEDGISCAADVLEEIDKYPIKYSGRVSNCLKKIGNNRNTMCLEFTTGLLCAEESVLSTLNSVLLPRNIPVFGGSAGNNMSGNVTKVALNGIVRERSAVFCLIHSDGGGFRFYKENIFKPVEGVPDLIATKVDIKTRHVKEYNHMPAAQAYANVLGVAENLISTYMPNHPMGRVTGNEIFISADNYVSPERGIVYHSRIYSNTRMKLLEMDDYRRVNEETFKKIKRDVTEPKLAFLTHCLGRTALFNNEGYMQEYARLLGSAVGNFFGYSGYGEQLKRYNFNMTACIVVFE